MKRSGLCLAMWAMAAAGVLRAGELPPLIPRAVLFGNPERSLPRHSPDGSSISWLAPDERGVLNVWTRPSGSDKPRLVTHEPHRPITWYTWSADGKHILYLQDFDGDENRHLYAADLENGIVRDLTPFRGIRAQNVLTSARRPGSVLVALNIRDRRAFDMYRVDLKSGAVTLEAENPGDVLSWTTDGEFVIRAATAFDPKNARTVIRVRDAADKPWRDLVVMPFESALFDGQVAGGSLVAGFAPDGRSLYLHSALNAGTGRLVRVDGATGRELEVVAQDPRSDVANDLGGDAPAVIRNPATGAVEAVKFDSGEPRWQFLDPGLKADFERIAGTVPGFLRITGRDATDRRWIVAASRSDAPLDWYEYDRDTRTVRHLFSDNAKLAGCTLAAKKLVTVTARDGLRLVCYLTVPPNLEAKKLPLVLDIHGGPNFRDDAEFDPEVQLLANRGYAVLQVNYRGSTGFGLAYLNAGTKQWGLGMQEDLYDAVSWAIREGIADPKRIAAMGWSGGGFATLHALAQRPDLFACGIDGVGPADVATLLRSFPPYWSALLTRWRLRVGDADHDDAWNRRISPLYHVDGIRAPLLIGQGAHDPRVTPANADMMVKALRDAKRDVVYIVYPDEGHGFARPENNMDFYGRVEEFLARHLGGRAEPWVKVKGSTAEVR